MLADVTERLPDGTWLVQLRWQGDKLVMAGYSPSATPLIAELEDSLYLSEVRFGSPVTPDPRIGRERFNITAAVAAPGGRSLVLDPLDQPIDGAPPAGTRHIRRVPVPGRAAGRRL